MRSTTTDDSTVQPPTTAEQASYAAAPTSAAGRFREARRRGEPQWLWPDVSKAEWRAALTSLAAAASALLAGRRPEPLRASDAAAERALCVAAYTSGLGPWLGWQAEQGRMEVDAGAARQLSVHLAHNRARWIGLRSALAGTLDVLEAAGTRGIVFKGMHTAQTCFEEPGLRPMADLDVVVGRADMARVEGALAAAGFRENRAARMGRPRRSEWRPPGSRTDLHTLMFVHRDDPYAIDLHGTLDIDFFGVRTVAFGEPKTWQVEPASWSDGRVSVLREPLLTAQLAVHASHGLHGLTLIRLVELTLVMRRDMRASADWSALHDLLRSLRAERFAYPALALTEQLAPGTVDPHLLKRCAAAAPPRLRGVVARMRPATAQRLNGLALEERFMWAEGPVEHLRRAGRMLLPGGSGGSLRRLGSIYADRAYRLMRRRVSWRSPR